METEDARELSFVIEAAKFEKQKTTAEAALSGLTV